jgi:hypothetical protein
VDMTEAEMITCHTPFTMTNTMDEILAPVPVLYFNKSSLYMHDMINTFSGY